MMYKKTNTASKKTIDYLNDVIADAKWKNVIGPNDNFKTWFHDVEIAEFPDYKQAFFLLIPPGGMIHRHEDTPKRIKTYHIPIKTNKKCVNIMHPGGGFHLEVGNIYQVNRQIEHESFNRGKTNRIHLLVEI